MIQQKRSSTSIAAMRAFLLFASFLSMPVVASDKPDGPVSNEMIRFDRATRQLDGFSHLTAVLGRYQTLTASYAGKEDGLSKSEASDLFEATYSVLGMWVDGRYVATLRLLYKRLSELNAVEPKHIRQMYYAERSVYDAVRANHIVKAFPELSLDPIRPLKRLDPHVSQGRILIAVDPEGAAYEKEVSSRDARLVILVNPLCNPSNKAIEHLAKSEDLKALLRDAMLLVQQEVKTDTLTKVSEWNRAHAPLTMYIVPPYENWSDLAGGATPTFFFLQDNALEFISEGLPEDAVLKRYLDSNNSTN